MAGHLKPIKPIRRQMIDVTTHDSPSDKYIVGVHGPDEWKYVCSGGWGIGGGGFDVPEEGEHVCAYCDTLFSLDKHERCPSCGAPPRGSDRNGGRRGLNAGRGFK